jgi:hypothetical protein
MLVLLYSAEITTSVSRETRLVVTLKLADIAPAGTMIVAGTVATFVLLLVRLITAPPEGAGALNVTVPVEVKPPLTLVGLRVSELSANNEVGVAVGGNTGVDVGVDAGVDVRVDFGNAVDVAVGVDISVGGEAPIHNVPVTFELL